MTDISNHPNVFNHMAETVGNTPLVRLNSVIDDLPCQIYAKVEFFNPGGSVKAVSYTHLTLPTKA